MMAHWNKSHPFQNVAKIVVWEYALGLAAHTGEEPGIKLMDWYGWTVNLSSDFFYHEYKGLGGGTVE